MTELEPCPFCGKEAVVRDFGLYEGMRDIRVGCVDAFLPRGDWGAPKSPCPVSPIAYNWSIGAETPEQMAEAWNARWVRTCQMLNDDWDDSFGEYKHLYECGICSESTALLCCINENGDTEWVKPKFCGNCGAKVVGE